MDVREQLEIELEHKHVRVADFWDYYNCHIHRLLDFTYDGKIDIASQLALRDVEIEQLKAEVQQLKNEKMCQGCDGTGGPSKNCAGCRGAGIR